MTTLAAAVTSTAARSAPGSRVTRLLALAFGLSMAYTVITTLAGTAPGDFDATTPVMWVGYLVGAVAAVLARKDEVWARCVVATVVGGFLVAAVLVYPHYFTPAHQDTFGWFENDAYVALLAIAMYEHLRRAPRPAR